MKSSVTLTPRSFLTSSGPGSSQLEVPALIVVWAPHEPARLGEALLIPPHPGTDGWLLGRGEPRSDGPWRRLVFERQRPGAEQSAGYLATLTLSRRQLELRLLEDGALAVRNVGRCPLLHNDREVLEAIVGPGDVLELRDQMMFLCVRRPFRQAPLPRDLPLALPPFGQPDTHGMVGESPAMWETRRQLAQLARHDEHVLILGASGTGKELAAQAIHALSRRRGRTLISRNAATFPETLIDVELFGNARNFPNPGMAERPGLIGEAHGSSLFLDEVGELPTALQPRLLRVLDRGEYQRLGDATVRHSDFRLIAATNRRPEELKHDLRARLVLSLELPGLSERSEDIPLLVRALLRRMATRTPYIAQRYFAQGDTRLEARIAPAFIRRLLRQPYATHVRELERILLRAVSLGSSDVLDLPGEQDVERSDPGSSQSPGRTRQPGVGLRDAVLDQERAATDDGVPTPRDSRGSAVEPGAAGVVDPPGEESPAPATRTDGDAGSPLFTDEDWSRLRIFREVDFHVEGYASHPAQQRSRSTANQHLLELGFKALCATDFSLDRAVTLLAESAEQQRQLRRRLEQHLEDLAGRLSTEGEAALKARLRRQYRASFPQVEAVLAALCEGRIPRI